MDRVSIVTKDCFNSIQQLRALERTDGLEPAHIHMRLRGFVDRMMQDAHRAGFSHEDAQAITYAICALADETIMSRPGPLRDFWMSQPLQLTYFNDYLAGENFFHHLDFIRRDPRRYEVARVYFECLLYGFQGRYRVRGAELALQEYVDTLRHELSRSYPAPDALSPDGRRPDELFVRVARGMPIVWISMGLVALSFLFYGGMFIALDEAVNEMLTWIATFTRTS